jgi:hypothetical protein
MMGKGGITISDRVAPTVVGRPPIFIALFAMNP